MASVSVGGGGAAGGDSDQVFLFQGNAGVIIWSSAAKASTMI